MPKFYPAPALRSHEGHVIPISVALMLPYCFNCKILTISIHDTEMRLSRFLSSPVGVALVFLALASLTVSFARFTGGVAMVWIAGAQLAGRLVVMPENRWGPWLIACSFSSLLATGLFGMGWTAAVPLAFINIAEAAAAALLMRRISIAFWPEETLEWIAGFYIGIGLIIPLVSGALATVVANLTIGASILESFTHWIIGHSLGLITCLPVFRFAYWRWSRGRNCLPNPEKWPFAAMILGGFAMLTIVVFTLDMRPLLVFPLLFVVVGSAMLEEALIAAMPVVLILIGGTFTAFEMGPIALMDMAYGDRIQFFQLYVAVTVLAALPIACERSRRLAELRRMQERLAQLEALEPSAY